MEARMIRAAFLAVALASMGASYRTQNYLVTAPSKQVAQQVGDAAERYRRDLAIEWLGREMPPWAQPCPITVQVGERLGAGGATSFVFDRGEVFGWQMTIQGSLERVLDSVLPHEVTHMVFASHFRRPLPRWADEGACTTVEHPAERTKQQQMLITFLKTGKGIPFSSMFAMKEYPADVLPLYAQGHSLATYLIQQGGKAKFLQFVQDGLQKEDWTNVTHRHYGFSNLRILQDSWLDWVAKGSPPLETSIAATPAVIGPSGVVPVAAAQPMAAAGPVAQTAAAPPLADGLNQWVAVQSSTNRSQPDANQSYNPAPVSNVAVAPQTATGTSPAASADGLVPVTMPGTPPAAPADPFNGRNSVAANPSPPMGFMPQGEQPSIYMRTGAGRPQMPQSPGQVVLEWTKPVEQPIPLTGAYSSGLRDSGPATATLPTGVQSSGLPVVDARGGETIRREPFRNELRGAFAPRLMRR